MKKIYFAGGCFWGVERYFQLLKGVERTVAGYANGVTKKTNYKKVCWGTTKHAEAVEITYDPEVITLEDLVLHLFRIIDPTSVNRQGNDVGVQYRSGVYYSDKDDKEVIEEIHAKMYSSFKDALAVEFGPLFNFCIAEDYHQNYLIKNPGGYCHIDFRMIKKNERK